MIHPGIFRRLDAETGWQAFGDGIPLGPQSAGDIGHACAYLASGLAVNVTGEAVNVSGGQRMHCPPGRAAARSGYSVPIVLFLPVFH